MRKTIITLVIALATPAIAAPTHPLPADPLGSPMWSYRAQALFGDATVVFDPRVHVTMPAIAENQHQYPVMVDARALADALVAHANPQDALKAYEAERVQKAAKVVRTNRDTPPDFINIKVEELTDDKPFDNLDAFITQDELRALSDQYKVVAGYALTPT